MNRFACLYGCAIGSRTPDVFLRRKSERHPDNDPEDRECTTTRERSELSKEDRWDLDVPTTRRGEEELVLIRAAATVDIHQAGRFKCFASAMNGRERKTCVLDERSRVDVAVFGNPLTRDVAERKVDECQDTALLCLSIRTLQYIVRHRHAPVG